jgi:hypothetical protein
LQEASVFFASEQFDIACTDTKDMLTFGYGVKYCLGAPLARMEGSIVLEEVTKRLPTLRLAPDQKFEYARNTACVARCTSSSNGMSNRAGKLVMTHNQLLAGTRFLEGWRDGRCSRVTIAAPGRNALYEHNFAGNQEQQRIDALT